MFKVGDKIRVLIGVYIHKYGTVDVIADNAPKSVGVKVSAEGALMTTWFRPKEIEKA